MAFIPISACYAPNYFRDDYREEDAHNATDGIARAVVMCCCWGGRNGWRINDPDTIVIPQTFMTLCILGLDPQNFNGFRSMHLALSTQDGASGFTRKNITSHVECALGINGTDGIAVRGIRHDPYHDIYTLVYTPLPSRVTEQDLALY